MLWESRRVERARIETREAQRRPEARRGGTGAGLPALQRALGNAGMRRLLAPQKRTLARFGEGEHKAIGDRALPDRVWALPGANLFKELEITFGEWISLGDWFEDIAEIKETLRAHRDADTVGQVRYAILVMIRPKDDPEERRKAEAKYMGVLFDERDKKAVLDRYADLKARNIKHFPNPLKGDLNLTTAGKTTRRGKDGRPLGAIAQYHSDHLEAIELARKGGGLKDERFLGEALAMDGFACHYLTDAYSGSHLRTPRASIKEYWEKKEPRFLDNLVNFLADEVTFAIETSPSGVMEWIGSLADQLTLQGMYAVRNGARKEIRKVVPKITFGDLVGLIVHDWEGEHGADLHGPMVEVAGQRFRLAGDEKLMAAASRLEKFKTDAQLTRLLKDKTETDDARTFAGATLAVRASVRDVERAFELGKKGKKRDEVVAALLGKGKLFASERLIPNAVPDRDLPKDERMPKWDYATADQLLADPKIKAALPISGRKVGEPFRETIKGIPASTAVKNQLERAVVDPLTSKNVKIILDLLRDVLHYSPDRVKPRLAHARRVQEDLRDVIRDVH
jgi:hypothetical protein